MATGPGQNTGVVQPRVSELVSIPAVEPRGTSTLVDAFHKGFVTADDIIGRIDNRARLKKKAEEQLYKEQLSPEAQDARAALQQATALEAKARVQKAEIDSEEMPYIKEMRRTEAARKIAQAQSFGTIDTVANQFTMLGVELPVRKDPKTGLTVPDQARIRQVYDEDVAPMLMFRSSVNDRIKQLKDQEFTVGESKGQGVLDTAGSLNPAQARKLRETLLPMTGIPLSLWKSLGRPTSPDVFLETAPGTVAAAPAARPTSSGIATSTFAAAPEVGQDVNGIVMTNVPGEGGKPGTEVQIRAKAALARFQESGRMQDALAEQGFDPASVGVWFNAVLPELIKTGDVKMWGAAKSAWSQGVLRMESGAAISKHEQAWYENSFFPQVNDPVSVVQAKDRMRSDMERVIAEIANAGGAASPETIEAAQAVVARAGQLSGWSGAKGTKNPATIGFEKRYRPDGTIVWWKNGQIFEANTPATPAVVPVTPATPAVVPVTPVKTAPAKTAPVVERREETPINPWRETAADIVNPFRAYQKSLKK